MKSYKDKKISFSYPNEFKLTRVKPKWGQYSLQGKNVLITIYLLTENTVDSAKTIIQSDIPSDVEDFVEIEYFDSVSFGENSGIGHCVTLYDQSHNFYEKLYRCLFLIPTGGIYVEISSSQDFKIDIYAEFLESIRLVQKSI